ncbi:MAG TPA: hypothetical protein DCS85_09270 [Verrucomicrobiales bacterium]|nr:hypothetical protein [Verrucomicrobiales bacterium]
MATIGFSASAREPRGDVTPLPENSPSFPCLVHPDVDGIATEEALDAPRIHQLPDGTIIITLNWSDTEGESVEQHSADLILTSMPVPEPSYPFLGACAGCVVLLHRRRPMSGNFRPARVSLSGLPLERISSQCSARAPLSRQPVASHRLIARRSTGRASLRPLRVA